ncbi:hypothetical protein TcCL_Unassigned03096 [Trypanosoma cruzi]|nr:hypothetical protein TcCL_Unassigned03096 [Trypanosoma cruzi]
MLSRRRRRPRGGGGAAAAPRCIGLPRLRRAAVGNIAREHSHQRSRLAGDCATSVGRDSTGAGARRAQPALAHRQRCRTQSRCQSGRRESGDGDGAARDDAPATLALHGDAPAQPSCRFVTHRRHQLRGRASWRGSRLTSVVRQQCSQAAADQSFPHTQQDRERREWPATLSVRHASFRAFGWRFFPRFPATSLAAVGEGGVDHRSVRAAGSGCKTAQKRTQYAARARGNARQTVADGQVRRTRREGPIHIPVNRGHASTNCAGSCGDRST